MKIRKDPENGKRKIFRKIKLAHTLWTVNYPFCEEIRRLDENPENPEKHPEKRPEKNIIISYLIKKLSILWRNMVKTIEIWRFEKNHQKQDEKFWSMTARTRTKYKPTLHDKPFCNQS